PGLRVRQDIGRARGCAGRGRRRPDAREQLKERLAEVTDLGKVARLLSWDQQTMMPPAGNPHRADQSATVQRLAHELFTDPEVGWLLDQNEAFAGSLDPDSDDAALIRVTR